MSPDPAARADEDNAARRRRPDLIAAGVAVGLFAVAAVAGGVLYLLGRPVHASAAPLFAHWLPHVGPGTPLALVVAVLVWWRGLEIAARLSWWRLLAVAYLTSVLWTLSLALIDGWQRGVAGRLTTEHEYLHEVPGVTDIPLMLSGFTARILDFQPDSWTTHVSGHPPGALLVFVWLDRIGLSGGGWAAALVLLVSSLVAVAVPETVRLLSPENQAKATGHARETGSSKAISKLKPINRPIGAGRAKAADQARAVVPFVVLFPGAVWSGVSADGLFAGVTATGVALLAHGAVRCRAVTTIGGGALLAFGCYLSYGLVLMSALATAVLLLILARRPSMSAAITTASWALVGAVSVVAAFTIAGFSWFAGYHLVIERYYQGIASARPYAYWVWADIAVLAVAAGPAAAVIIRRAFGPGLAFGIGLAVRTRPRVRTIPQARAGVGLDPGWVLPLAALVAIVAADLSGYSKAEVERIWLPFAVWLMAGAVLIPRSDRRMWLAAQAVVALVVNHLLLTRW